MGTPDPAPCPVQAAPGGYDYEIPTRSFVRAARGTHRGELDRADLDHRHPLCVAAAWGDRRPGHCWRARRTRFRHRRDRRPVGLQRGQRLQPAVLARPQPVPVCLGWHPADDRRRLHGDLPVAVARDQPAVRGAQQPGRRHRRPSDQPGVQERRALSDRRQPLQALVVARPAERRAFRLDAGALAQRLVSGRRDGRHEVPSSRAATTTCRSATPTRCRRRARAAG